MKTAETIEMERKMRNKSYRFYWFARQSWAFHKGQRTWAVLHFLPAWRGFNRACVNDMRDT